MSTASKVTFGLSAVFCGTAMLYNYYEDNKQKDRRSMGVKADIARYEAKYEEKEEIRRKNKELQDAQIALEKALKEGK